MPYVNRGGEKYRLTEKEYQELSAKIVHQRIERDKAKLKESGQPKWEPYKPTYKWKRGNERIETVRGIEHHSKFNIDTGETRYWTVYPDGRRVEYDSRGNEVSQPGDEGLVFIIGLAFFFCFIAMGGFLRGWSGLSMLQGAVCIWTVTAVIVGLLLYCRKKAWITTNTKLSYGVGSVLGIALLMTFGWWVGGLPR